RGANIFNILNYDKDFQGARVIKLEQNYRSTKNIIGAASAVISNNSQRKGKTLFTENPDGDLIDILESPTEYDEALSITYNIQKIIEQTQYTYSDIAIFYRTNAQSRVLEEKLRNFDVPYKIFGGLKFYDRKEIKDINSYMRLVVNPKDDVSFRRVINTPTRGLGKTTLEKIEALATEMNLSMLEASIQILESKSLTARTKSKLQGFLNILTQLRESCVDNGLYEFYQDLLQISGYMPALENEETVEANSRIQNLEEFGNAIARYLELNPVEQHITQFLHHMALVSDADKEVENNNSVTLMTLHIAKGLEYPVVYVAGLEEGLFPHMASSDITDPGDMEMEEERRLFYVGMTRAEEKLTLSYAKQRKVWGQNQYQSPSRFISEVPESFLKNKISKKRPRFADNYSHFESYSSSEKSTFASDPFPDYESGDGAGHSYQKGTRVRHPHFGSGVIHKVEGQGSKEKVSVLFDDQTFKKFLSQYANLELG
ncbi:MAG: 3'-5' exonuclease, partial [Pseudomonadota bacterium]